jgi:hypothetical protein
MRIVTIVCWVIVGLVLLGLAGWFATGTVMGIRSDSFDNRWPFRFNVGGLESLSGPYSIVGTYTADASGLDSINIHWVAGNITVMPHDGSEILITELAQRSLRDYEKLQMNASGGTLTIRFRERGSGGISGPMPQKRLEVLVPQGLSGDMASLDINSVSGAVTVEDLNPDTLNIDTISGNINLSNITSREIEVDSTSGTITVANVTATGIEIDSTSGRISASGAFDSARLKSISGRISLDNLVVRSTVRADSTSGTIDLNGAFYGVQAGSLSGSITITSIIVPSSIKANSTSGTISVTVPNEDSITVFHSSTSGRFTNDIPVILQGRGAQFELTTLSGNIMIYEMR